MREVDNERIRKEKRKNEEEKELIKTKLEVIVNNLNSEIEKREHIEKEKDELVLNYQIKQKEHKNNTQSYINSIKTEFTV